MKHLNKVKLIAAGLPLLFMGKIYGQEFLNGSFEKNGGLCIINAAVPVFNSNVKNTKAFGSFRKPDIAGNDCGHGSAQDGSWFIGLASNIQGDVRSEAVSLELSSALVKGNQYSLSFWTRSRTFASHLEIGVSTNDSTAGQLVYTVAASSISAQWTEINIRFTAPENGKYITVRATNQETNSGVWLDHFNIRGIFVPENVVMMPDAAKKNTEPVKPASEIKVAAPSIELYPNPGPGVFRVSGNNSDLLSLVVYNTLGSPVAEHKATEEQPIPESIDLTGQQPGLYFVEMATATGKITKRIIVSR